MSSIYRNPLALEPLHIEICGAIAAGKTILANLLKHAGLKDVLEDFRANCFFEQFYSDPAKYAFETEITFLLQHYHQIKVNAGEKTPFICDFSPILDLAYADVTLSSSERETFFAVYKEVKHQLSPPALLIHLQCSASVLLDRIRARGRAAEKSISIEYLKLIDNALTCRLQEVDKEVKILTISSEKRNFATDELEKRNTISLIQERFREEYAKPLISALLFSDSR